MSKLGFGLILAAVFAFNFWIPFVEWLPSTAPYANILAMATAADGAVAGLGAGAVMPATFLFFCAGAGILAAGQIIDAIQYLSTRRWVLNKVFASNSQ